MEEENREENREETRTKRETGKQALSTFLFCLICLLAGSALTLAGMAFYLGDGALSMLRAYVLVERKFVGDYESETVREASLDAMVESLGDRWSYYLNPEEYQRTKETRKNAYVGIGVTVSQSDESLQILAVAEGGPADRAGLRPGESIREVDGKAVTPETRSECVDAIAGKPGTSVTLTVEGTDGALRTVTITREKIQNISAAWTMLEGDTALLVIGNFYAGTAEQVRTCLDEMTAQNAKALVVDVRYNPGGYVTELAAILDDLLPEGEVFHSETLSGRETSYTSDADCIGLPIGVLVNGDSYSAAEFLAAQLRESAGAVIVGTQTCGKGFAQTLFALPDGSALGLSTSRYVTGSGVSLIGTGVTPDQTVELSDKENEALYAGILPVEEDAQLQAVLTLLSESSY